MIAYISIKNFRSIKEVSLALPRFSAIIGKNSSGKSNFISAIGLFTDLVRGKNLEDALTRIAPLGGEFFHFQTPTKEADFEFIIETNIGNQYKFHYQVVLKRIGQGFRMTIENEILSWVSEDVEKIVYRREKENAFIGEHGVEKIPFKVEPDKLMLSSYSHEAVQEVVSTVAGYTILDTIPESSTLIVVNANRPNLNSIDGVVVSLFTKNQGRFEGAVKSIQKIIPYFEAPILTSLPEAIEGKPTEQIESKDEIKRYLVTWRERSYTEQYSNISLSHGDRKVIHLIFSLFNTPEKSFFIAEEIENGMHFERMSRLVDQFRTQANNRKTQVLFTTHSSEILKRLAVNEMIFCRKDQENGSKLDPITDTEEYKSIEKDLTGGDIKSAADVLKSGLFD